ncbi:MAG: sigma-70 family RNA polymerase sigma factor [Planctomycetes bacterium]|nr:sigma-70 family RNA polymerase sigma factor [Planctomycetota bacterium]
MFETTRKTFLGKLSTHDGEAWRQFTQNYAPMIQAYARRAGLQPADADDVAQTVWHDMSKSLPRFTYDPAKGRFRDYLARVASNAVRRFHARRADRRAVRLDTAVSDGLATGVDLERRFVEEWRDHHCRLALAHLRKELESKSLDVFEQLLRGTSVDECACQFMIGRDAIYKIRDRVRRRLHDRIREQMRREDDYYRWA